MKNLLFFLLCCMALSTYARHTTFTKLADVNRCWKEQPDISLCTLPAYCNRSESEWIRTHLALVETTLRKRSTGHLSAAQLHNRTINLDHLHNYLLTGNFPVNDRYGYRTPIFIDPYNNFCAVGYLLMASGNEHISRMIAATNNLAYVKQMHYPELNKWASDNGFTINELAWIQPGYIGYDTSYCTNIGMGVNGEVRELYADESAGRMYVGGAFTIANGTVPTNGITYITPAGPDFEWHNMGTGITGTVNAIEKYEGKIFAGGSFTSAGGAPASNIAWWDGASWHAAGCLNGTVNDLIVMQGRLFAGGKFEDCTSGLEANFAQWNGTDWESIYGIHGHINTFAVSDGFVLDIGGGFTIDTVENIIYWGIGHGFFPFDGHILNEVMSIATVSGAIYAVCKQTHPTDTNLMFTIGGSGWQPPYFSSAFYLRPLRGARSVNTIFMNFPFIEMGGEFIARTGAENGCYIQSYNEPLKVDSAVNKIAQLGATVIFGGKFRYGTGGDGITYTELNNIAQLRGRVLYAAPDPLQQNTQPTIYPNPISVGEILNVRYSFNAHLYTISDITGKQLAAGTMNSGQTVTMPQVAPGVYIITLSGDNGMRRMEKIVVR